MNVGLIIVTSILAITCIVLAYYLARTGWKFRQWKETEYRRLDKARKEGAEQSRAVLGGKFTEQMVPYLPEFK